MFYTFIKNNSAGSYDIEDGVDECVIIEADTAGEANDRAISVGIYFNGCEDGRDCDCCGDRWDAQDSDDTGTEVPESMRYRNVIVYYKNGTNVLVKRGKR
jgi:hypothetical protein